MAGDGCVGQAPHAGDAPEEEIWAQEEGDFTGTCMENTTLSLLWIPAGDLGWDLGDTSDAWGLDQLHRSLFTCWLPSHLPVAVISIHGSGNDCRGVKVMIPIQLVSQTSLGNSAPPQALPAREKVGSTASPAVPLLTHCWDTPWEK